MIIHRSHYLCDSGVCNFSDTCILSPFNCNYLPLKHFSIYKKHDGRTDIRTNVQTDTQCENNTLTFSSQKVSIYYYPIVPLIQAFVNDLLLNVDKILTWKWDKLVIAWFAKAHELSLRTCGQTML